MIGIGPLHSLTLPFSTKSHNSKAQTKRNTVKKGKRKEFTTLKKQGAQDQLVHASHNTSRNQKRLENVLACGFDPNGTFLDCLANGNILLLAAGVTDASPNHAESVINFTCKTAATQAMADLMIDYKKFNKPIMEFTAPHGYDCDSPPRMSSALVFNNQSKTKTKKTGFFNQYMADDEGTIEHLQEAADQLDALRGKIQDWYRINTGTGVISRQTRGFGMPYVARRVVKRLVEATLEEPLLRNLFLGLLDCPTVDRDEGDQVRVEAILNGSFYFTTDSTTAFFYCAHLTEFGFPSSRSNACKLNRQLWNDLMERSVALGHSRQDTLAKFLLVWAAMDGSILKDYFAVIVPNDPDMIAFFRDIFTELHDGMGYHLSEHKELSDTPYGKDICHLRLKQPY